MTDMSSPQLINRDRVPGRKAEVWVVDDSRSVLSLVNEILQDEGHEVRTFSMPIEAVECFYEHQPDVIISDIMMPELDGIGFLEKIVEVDDGLPVILMTSNPGTDSAIMAVRHRAFEYLVKPVDEKGLRGSVRRALQYRDFHAEQKKSLSYVENMYYRKIASVDLALSDMKNTTFDVLRALIMAAGFRDNETGEHIMRIGIASHALAMKLGLPKEFCENIFYASPMHDIGKIGISDAVLLKNGPLNMEEFNEMKEHTKIGARILSEGSSELMNMAREIALNHHEKWDGTGYPSGRRGLDIPLAARIVMLVDTYDALRSNRPYRNGYSHEDAIRIMSVGDGRVMPDQFDPDMLGQFLAIQDEFRNIFKSG